MANNKAVNKKTKTSEIKAGREAEIAAFEQALAEQKTKAPKAKKASLTADLKAGAILAKDSLGEIIPEQTPAALVKSEVVKSALAERAEFIAKLDAPKAKAGKGKKAPVTPAQAKKAVEAVVAKIVTEKAAEAQPLKLRLYAKGEFYFGKAAAEKLAGLPYVKIAVDGKLITLTPTKSAKDAQEVKFSHGNPVVRVSKLLAETGWSKATQDLAVTMVGDAIQVQIS